MHIMHISTRLILGGSQENTVLSARGQADLGHDVSLVFGPIHGPEGTLLPDVASHGKIATIETPNLIRELAPLRDHACLNDLRAIIRDQKPDVVHTHSSKAGVLGRIAAWKEKVPAVIHTIHGLPFHPYQGRLRRQGKAGPVACPGPVGKAGPKALRLRVLLCPGVQKSTARAHKSWRRVLPEPADSLAAVRCCRSLLLRCEPTSKQQTVRQEI